MGIESEKTESLREFRAKYEQGKYEATLRHINNVERMQMAHDAQIGALHSRIDQLIREVGSLETALGELASKHARLIDRLKERFDEQDQQKTTD